MHKKTIHSVSVDVGGRPMTLETGWLAKQAGGAVVVKQNDSAVLVTFVTGSDERPFDFLPLTVNYEDRTAADGRIPGGFLKREGRPDERGTLICRVIDRPIRPQFPKHFRRALQCMATALSFDPASDTDVLALCGASAAAHISEAPLGQAIAGVRVSRVEGEFKINPSRAEMDLADINLVVAGSADAICMVEGGAQEASEADMLQALDLAQAAISKICAAIDELKAKAGKDKVTVPEKKTVDADVAAKMEELGKASLIEALAIREKHARSAGLKAARNAVIAQITDGIEDGDEVARLTSEGKAAWSALLSNVMRTTVIEKGTRIDGRATREIRDITVEVGVAARTHGSAVFTRGETQAFVSATMGIEMDAQRIDFAGATDNAAAGCSSTTSRPSAPVRPVASAARSAGRSATARWRTAPSSPWCPARRSSPTSCAASPTSWSPTRSSSMATVCGASLALMDAGVPSRSPWPASPWASSARVTPTPS